MLRAVMFFLVIVPLWGFLHWYMGRRLLTHAKAPQPLKALGWGVIILNACLVMLAFMVRRMGVDQGWQAPLIWLAYLGLGGFCLTITMLLARDALWGIYALITRTKMKPDPTDDESPQLSRRQLFSSATSTGIAVAGIAGTVKGHQNATRMPDVRKVKVPVKGLEPALKGMRIVQISDIHVGNTITPAFLKGVVEMVNTLNADLVAITGDLVDGFPDKMLKDVSALGDLKATHGAFFVTGNHEYYWDGPGWIKAVRSLGVTALVNEHKVIMHKGKKVVVGGVTDYSAARMLPSHASDPHKAIKGAPQDAAFKLLLAHQPKSIYKASEAGFDLQLSGHTHGGQFYPWNFVVGMVHPFSRGLHTYKQKTQIYVSCGTGFWGPPMRLGAPSEITLLELVPV